jgi:hypothetical protein
VGTDEEGGALGKEDEEDGAALVGRFAAMPGGKPDGTVLSPDTRIEEAGILVAA